VVNTYDVQAKKILAREDIDVKFIVEQYMPLVLNQLNAEITAQIRFNLPISGEFYYMNMERDQVRLLINQLLVIKVARQRAVQEYYSLLQLAAKVLPALKKTYKFN
jgi:hypothetical protein